MKLTVKRSVMRTGQESNDVAGMMRWVARKTIAQSVMIVILLAVQVRIRIEKQFLKYHKTHFINSFFKLSRT